MGEKTRDSPLSALAKQLVTEFELWDKFGGYHGFVNAPTRVTTVARLIAEGKGQAQHELQKPK